MDLEQKYKLKAFLWDQFIRPIYLFFNIHQIKLILIVFAGISIIILKSTKYFLILLFLLILIYFYELVKYYKSGEYMSHYKNYKYPEFRKAIKEIRKARKIKESPESISKLEDEKNKGMGLDSSIEGN